MSEDKHDGSSQTFVERLDALKNGGSVLAKKLGAAARQLKAGALDPSPELVSELQEHQAASQAFVAELRSALEHQDADGSALPAQVASTEDLRRACIWLDDRNSELLARAAQASNLSSRLVELAELARHAGAVSGTELLATDVSEAQAALAEASPDTARLGEVAAFWEQHPALLIWDLAAPKTGPDEQARLFEIVSQRYGTVLALAAVTGRLGPSETAAATPDADSSGPVEDTGSEPPGPIDEVAAVEEDQSSADDGTASDPSVPNDLPVVESATEDASADDLPVAVSDGPLVDAAEELDTTPEPPTVADQDETDADAEEKAEESGIAPAVLERFQGSTSWEQACAVARELAKKRQPHAADVQALTWLLVAAERYGLAGAVLRWAEHQGTTLGTALDWRVAEAVGIARSMTVGGGELERELRSRLWSLSEDQLFVEGREDDNDAMRFVLAAAAMKPALLSPSNGAASVLAFLNLRANLDRNYALWTCIRERCQQGVYFDPAILEDVEAMRQHDAHLLQVQEEAAQWLRLERACAYQRASEMWRFWVQPDGQIGMVLRALADDDRQRIDAVREALTTLQDARWVQREMHRYGRVNRPIEGGARQQVTRWVQDVADIATRWLQLASIERAGNDDAQVRQAHLLREEVGSRLPDARAEVQGFCDGREGICSLMAAQRIYLAALDDLKTMVTTESGRVPERAWHLTQGFDLIRIPGVSASVHEDGDLDHFELQSVLDYLAVGGIDWLAALTNCVDRGDFQRAAEILTFAAAMPELAVDVERWQQRLDDEVSARREQLQRLREEAQGQLDVAAANGLVAEIDRDRLQSELQALDPAVVTVFNPLERLLRDMANSLAQSISNKASELRAAASTRGLDETAQQGIERLLEHDELLVAEDLLNRTEPLQESDFQPKSALYDEFYPRFVDALGRSPLPYEDKPSQGYEDLLRAVRRGQDYGVVAMSEVRAAPQRRSAAEMADAWFKIKRDRNADGEQVRNLLGSLGFEVEDVRIEEPRRASGHDSLWGLAQAKPLEDREICALPRYGSLAAGRYRLLLFWGRPNVDLLLGRLGEQQETDPPPLLLFFGRMTEADRRDFMLRVKRGESKGAVLIDDALVLFMAMQNGDRLRVLFECGLPFTRSNPYTTTGSTLAPEMFFGRQSERDAIPRPGGGSLVYGGRQIGKTVLLKAVQRRFDRPAVQNHGFFFDLKGEGLEISRPADDLWSILIDAFRNRGILPSDIKASAGVEVLLRETRRWIDEDPTRRILLLLDEADRFIEEDTKPPSGSTVGYARVSRLKSLMDQTDQRFKVVFAGLHNVQQFATGSNTPLAHLGRPICVGPLIDRRDVRYARDLIERPLQALGYELPAALVWSILSRTNYYPNLIQIFCYRLLERLLSEDPERRIGSGSRIPVTADDVAAVMEDEVLLSDFRDRVAWTLDLDQRYWALTCTVADHQSQGATAAVPLEVIDEEVRIWWEAGFANDRQQEIGFLLDELCGLGILRQEGEGYTLRSAGVIKLLGGAAGVQRKLNQLGSETGPPRSLGPHMFRRRNDYDPYQALRSPLTLHDEQVLIPRDRSGVSMIFGVPYSGLDDVREFVRLAAGLPGRAPELKAGAQLPDLLHEVEQRTSKSGEGIELLVVPQGCAWDVGWVSQSQDLLSSVSETSHAVRVIFVGGAQQAWQWQTVAQEPAASAMPVLYLRPWTREFIGFWADELGVTDSEVVDQILETTGGWPHFIGHFQRLLRAVRDDPWAHIEAVETAIEQEAGEASFRAGFGLDQGVSADLFATLLEFGEPVGEETLLELTDGASPNDVRRFRRWAERMSLCVVRSGMLDPGPVVRRIRTP